MGEAVVRPHDRRPDVPLAPRVPQPERPDHDPRKPAPPPRAHLQTCLPGPPHFPLQTPRAHDPRGTRRPALLEGRKHLVRRLKAVLRLLGQAAEHHVRQPARDLGVHVARDRNRVGQVLADDLGARLAIVGRRAGHHLEQHRPEGVQVAPPVQVRLPEGLLRTHVLDGANGEPGRGLGAAGVRVEQLRDPEVDEQGAPGLAFEHHVVRLDVAVHQPLRVGVRERLENRLADLEGVVGGNHAAAPQRVGERLALDERHDVVDQAFAVAGEMNREDGGMLEPRQRLRFLAEARDHPRRPRDLGMQDLTSEAPVEVYVPQLVYLREPAAADQLLDLVFGPQRPGKALDRRLGSRGRRWGRGRRRPLARDHRGRRIAARRAERGAER